MINSWHFFDVFLDAPSVTLRLTPSVLSKWSFPEKKNKWGIEDILSWKLPLEFLGFLFYPRKLQKNQSFTPETPQNCVTLLGIFKAWNQDPWKLHMIFFFFDHPWKFHVAFKFHPQLPQMFGFFSGIARWQVLKWYTYLVIFVDIEYVVLKF